MRENIMMNISVKNKEIFIFFYDTPLIHKDPQTNTLKFDCARCIAEIPNYMYTDIKDGDCYEINIIMDKCRYKEFNSPNNTIT